MSYTENFEDLDTDEVAEAGRWLHERDRAYNGSLRHLLASLAAGTYEEEGFTLNPATVVPTNFLTQELSATPLDSADVIIDDGSSPYEKVLSFDDYLMVTYLQEDEEDRYFKDVDRASHYAMTYDPALAKIKPSHRQISYIKLRDYSVRFNLDGTLADPLSIVTYGYMSWERAADVVPLEYRAGMFEPDDVYLEELRPETHYFRALAAADSIKFVQEIEAPLLLVMKDDERRHYDHLATLDSRKEFVMQYVKAQNRNPLFAVNYWSSSAAGTTMHGNILRETSRRSTTTAAPATSSTAGRTDGSKTRADSRETACSTVCKGYLGILRVVLLNFSMGIFRQKRLFILWQVKRGGTQMKNRTSRFTL